MTPVIAIDWISLSLTTANQIDMHLIWVTLLSIESRADCEWVAIVNLIWHWNNTFWQLLQQSAIDNFLCCQSILKSSSSVFHFPRPLCRSWPFPVTASRQFPSTFMQLIKATAAGSWCCCRLCCCCCCCCNLFVYVRICALSTFNFAARTVFNFNFWLHCIKLIFDMLPQTSPSSLASSPLFFALLGSAPHLLVSSSTCDVVASSAAAGVVVVVVVIAHDWHFWACFGFFFSCYFSAPPTTLISLFIYFTVYCDYFTLPQQHQQQQQQQQHRNICSHQWQMKIDFCRLFISDLQLQVASQVEVAVAMIENVTHNCHWDLDRDGVGVGDGDRALHKRNNAEHANTRRCQR